MTLGEKLRDIRKARGLTLQRVATASGLSKAFVSQIESGAANPSLASLKRVGDALGIPLAALFDDSSNGERATAPSHPSGDVRIVRKDRRKKIVWPGRNTPCYLLTPDVQGRLEVLLDVLEPGTTSGGEDERCITHEGEEFALILEGRYELTVGAESFTLEEGDSVTYSSRLPHRGRALGAGPVKTLWVITPPSF